MRSIAPALGIVLFASVCACSEKPKPPPLEVVDAGAEPIVDAGLLADVPAVAPVAPVDTLPAPMVIAGYNVPQPRGFRRAQKTDAIGSPQIDPWLSRGDIVLIDEAAFPPGTVDVGFVSMLNLPPTLTLEECAKLAKSAAEAQKGEAVGDAALLDTGLGPTCTYELKLPAGVVRAAIAVVESRSLGIVAEHAAGDEKTSAAWSDVVKGMRKTNP